MREIERNTHIGLVTGAISDDGLPREEGAADGCSSLLERAVAAARRERRRGAAAGEPRPAGVLFGRAMDLKNSLTLLQICCCAGCARIWGGAGCRAAVGRAAWICCRAVEEGAAAPLVAVAGWRCCSVLAHRSARGRARRGCPAGGIRLCSANRAAGGCGPD